MTREDDQRAMLAAGLIEPVGEGYRLTEIGQLLLDVAIGRRAPDDPALVVLAAMPHRKRGKARRR